MTASAGVERSADVSASSAYRLLWLAVFFDVLAFGVGAGWDRRWHATHPFEDFFSPPHVFIYSMHFLATLTLMGITFMPDVRRHFGATFRLWPFPFPVPGATRGSVGLPLFRAFAAVPAFALGVWLADRIWIVVLGPTRSRVLTFAILAGLCTPAVTGALDLYLRARTP